MHADSLDQRENEPCRIPQAAGIACKPGKRPCFSIDVENFAAVAGRAEAIRVRRCTQIEPDCELFDEGSVRTVSAFYLPTYASR
jgi:hypothetical protein